MNQVQEHSSITKKKGTKYPIFFCKVTGRILSPTKPTKRKPQGGWKETPFTVRTSVKFNNKGTEPLSTRSYVIKEKYNPKSTDQIVYDSIEKIKYMTFTYVKE